jgi:acyl-CoA reductase-like NAD-dependent aldehyde dehydrogenase
LSLHKDVDKVTFTGSVPVGMKVMANASRGPVIKGVVLELGKNF